MTTILNIPLDLIDTAPQVRTKFKEDTIAELAADIRSHGVLQPLIVQQNGKRFTLLIGERRLRAIRYLGDTTAPAIIATISKELADEVQLMENIQREDLSTADLADAIKGLWKKHGSVTAVAKRINKSHSWVSKRLAIALNVGTNTASLLDAGVKDVEMLYHFTKLEKINPKKAHELVLPIIEGTIGRDDVKESLLADPSEDDLDALPVSKTEDEQGQLFEPTETPDAAEQMRINYGVMFEALEKIASMKDMKAIYKTRDAMREAATLALDRIKAL